MADIPFDQDASVGSDDPDGNYGAAPEFLVEYDHAKGGAQYQGYASVDFSALTDLTDASQVQAAGCKMYCRNAAGVAMGIRWDRVIPGNGQPGWDQSTITWNTRPNGGVVDSAVVSDVVVGWAGEWHTWDIASMIEDAVTNREKKWNGQAHFQSYSQNEVNYRGFDSNEQTAGNDPYITITYTVGEELKVVSIPFSDIKELIGVAQAYIKKVAGVSTS